MDLFVRLKPIHSLSVLREWSTHANQSGTSRQALAAKSLHDLLRLVQCEKSLLQGNRPEQEVVTGFDLAKERNVCAYDGRDLPVASRDCLNEDDDRLPVPGDLNRAWNNPLGYNRFVDPFYSVNGWSREPYACPVRHWRDLKRGIEKSGFAFRGEICVLGSPKNPQNPVLCVDRNPVVDREPSSSN